GASVISVGWADLHGFRSSVRQRSLLGPKCGASARHLRNPIRLRLAARGSSDEDLTWARCGVSRRRLEPGGTGGRARCSALPNRRWTDGDAIISYCFNWRPQGDSNPCYRRERAMSWASRRWGRGQAAGRARKITRPAPEEQCAGPIRARPPAVVARRAARQPQNLHGAL